MTNQIIYLDDEALKVWLAKPEHANTLIVDVREPNEAAREHIEGSINIPVSELSEERFESFRDKDVLFHCKLGSRTKCAEEKLRSLPCQQKWVLAGGLEQWKRCGQKTHIAKKTPIEVNRQVQIIVGTLIIVGTVLAYTVSINWLLLDLLFGCGLLFAGLTGFCGMAKLLMLLPFNRVE